MSTSATCQDCVRLWHEFSEASSTHVHLLKEQEEPIPADPGWYQTIDKRVEIAEARRDAARTAVRRHIAIAHLG